MAELELRGVSKSFGDQPVLRDLSLQVPDGSFTILLGPSGCGKSTLLRIIAGLDSQTAGQVCIDGTVVDHLPPAERDIAMVFQQYALYPHLSVRENLAFALTIRRTPRRVIDERIAAKQARDFARADAIRQQLADEGILLEDTAQGVRWKRA